MGLLLLESVASPRHPFQRHLSPFFFWPPKAVTPFVPALCSCCFPARPFFGARHLPFFFSLIAVRVPEGPPLPVFFSLFFDPSSVFFPSCCWNPLPFFFLHSQLLENPRLSLLSRRRRPSRCVPPLFCFLGRFLSPTAFLDGKVGFFRSPSFSPPFFPGSCYLALGVGLFGMLPLPPPGPLRNHFLSAFPP